MRYPSILCIILILLTIANFLIPDPLPVVDEVILTLVSMGA